MEMFPPNSVCNDAPILPTMERERTMMPRTMPSVFDIRKTSRVKAVVVMDSCIPGFCPPFGEIKSEGAQDFATTRGADIIYPRRRKSSGGNGGGFRSTRERTRGAATPWTHDAEIPK